MVFLLENHGFGKNRGFQLKATDLEFNRCENTFSFTFKSGAEKYTSIFGGCEVRYVDCYLKYVYFLFFGLSFEKRNSDGLERSKFLDNS